MDSNIRGARREKILAAAKNGDDLTDHPDALDENGWPFARIVRVVEYTVPDRVGNGTGELIVLLSTITRPRRRERRRAGRRLPRKMGTGNRKRPAQDPSARPREDPAVPAARPGPPGDLRLPDRAPRDLRAHREGVRRRRPGPRPHLVRQDPAPDPPLRHRDGGHSPLRTGQTHSPTTSTRSPR